MMVHLASKSLFYGMYSLFTAIGRPDLYVKGHTALSDYIGPAQGAATPNRWVCWYK